MKIRRGLKERRLSRDLTGSRSARGSVRVGKIGVRNLCGFALVGVLQTGMNSPPAPKHRKGRARGNRNLIDSNGYLIFSATGFGRSATSVHPVLIGGLEVENPSLFLKRFHKSTLRSWKKPLGGPASMGNAFSLVGRAIWDKEGWASIRIVSWADRWPAWVCSRGNLGVKSRSIEKKIGLWSSLLNRRAGTFFQRSPAAS